MALVNLVETSVQSTSSNDITYVIPYYLNSDSGPTTFTRVQYLSDLKNIFYPSVPSDNYYLAEYLVNLGYTLLVKRLDQSENYTSLRFFEAHTATYYADEVPYYDADDYTLKDVVFYQDGKKIEYQVRSYTPHYESDPVVFNYPQFTACPCKDVDYEYTGICYIGSYTPRLVNTVTDNRVLLNYGVDIQIDFTKIVPYSYLLLNRVSDDISEGTMQLIIFVDESMTEEEINAIDPYIELGIDSSLLDIISRGSKAFYTVKIPSVWTEEDTETFTTSLFNVLKDYGYVIESYELAKDEDGNTTGLKNLLISSAVPIGTAILSMYGDKTNTFIPLSSDDAYYQDTICAGFEDHKILDFYSKYPKSTQTIQITITKLLTDQYNLRITNTINSYIHEEFFQVTYDPESKYYIENVLRTSEIVTVKVYKSGIPIEPGTYTLGRIPEAKSEYDEATAINIINSGIGDINSFNFVVDCNLTLPLQQAIYDRFQDSLALKLFKLSASDVDLTRTSNTIYFYPCVEINDVVYPGYVAFLQLLIDDGLYCGELDFVDRLVYPEFEVPESKYVTELVYDNYRYLLDNMYVYRDVYSIPPETVVFTTRFLNEYLPSIDLFSTATNIENELSQLFKSIDFSNTKIDSVELNELTKDGRSLMIDYGINYNVDYMDSINLSLTINI